MTAGAPPLAGDAGNAPCRERVEVPFTGAAGQEHGAGELTWGQLDVWLAMREGTPGTIGGVSEVPPGTTVAVMAAALRFVLTRHPSLRTRLLVDGGTVRQEVAAAGTATLDVVPGGEDPAATAAAVCDRYLTTPFGPREWPVRMAAVCATDGSVTHSVAVYQHMMIDGHGLAVLVADLTTMDPATGEAPGPPPEAVHPLELARLQRTTAGRRQSSGSMRRWESVLRTVPPTPVPVADGPPELLMVGFRSPASALAVRVLAGRLGADGSAVLLAAVAVTLSRVLRTDPVVPLLAVGNRFRPGLGSAVAQLAQTGPCVLPVDGAPFAEVVARAAQAAMGTYLRSYYDPEARGALLRRLAAERGPVDLGVTLNDRRRAAADLPPPSPGDVLAALPLSRYRVVPRTDLSRQRLYLGVDDVPDGIDLTMSADTRFHPQHELELVLRTVEATLVEAALGG